MPLLRDEGMSQWQWFLLLKLDFIELWLSGSRTHGACGQPLVLWQCLFNDTRVKSHVVCLRY